MRRFSALIACAAACALLGAALAPPGASASALRPPPVPAASRTARPAIPVSDSNVAAAGHAMSAERVVAIAEALPKVRALRAEHPESTPFVLSGPSNARQEVGYYSRGKQIGLIVIDTRTERVLEQSTGYGASERFLAIANALPKIRALRAEYPKSGDILAPGGGAHRVVSYFSGKRHTQIGVVVIDARTGRVLEQWTGIQLTWTLARGEPSKLGRHVNALYVWVPLCVLFLLPFLDFRRPFSLLHLDLLVLLSFSVSLAFFNHAHIYASVPLVYPPLIYLLARMLALMGPGSARGQSRQLRLLVPAPWLALAVVLLIGFRIALNVTDSTVIDVGTAGPIGAQRIVDGLPLYGGWPGSHNYQDNYGPVIYEASIPFEQAFGYNYKADPRSQPAPHVAAIFFDLLVVAVLFLLGRRLRGSTLGIVLAYAWVSYPFTFFALENNANDALIAALILAALLAATYRSKIAGTTRGAFAALAGLTKFAPLAAAPVLATHGLRELPPARRPFALALFLAGFLGAAALVFIPALSHNSLHTFYERTIASTANRETPFSVWGLYGGLGGLQLTVRIAAVVLGLSLAVVPRRPDVVGLAAACAAAIIAVQLADGYWFYMYILWFFPLVMVALLGRFSAPGGHKRSGHQRLLNPPVASR